ncbi:hypothetical protein P3X46_005013 [Hevea brasiliensis]|uniref:DUF3741 domain-containing protein n=1 Tax=Hevea brasiliensis TaxID=3981 RepID=A0ABQ9MYJ4_HEVBR|nr:uncharacterized protein LOC110641083 [Hevea brasiliensis]KAJ9185371.1 hypothetical protein P3X46_005013 [Hevea brasiliensis]
MTISNSAAGSGSGCLSGIARLLLCKGSLQTHPSDQITYPNTAEFDRVNKYQKNEVNIKLENGTTTATAPAAAAAPGVVARLMGLDSLPDTNWVPKGRTPDSVTRSRSVNFMDYLLDFDLSQAQHRRVKTSVSFREVPTLLNQQNQHDFFVLYLDNTEKTKKGGSKLRKSEVGLEELKQQKNKEKSKNKVINNTPAGRAGMKKKEKNQRNNLNISKLKDEPMKVSNNKQISSFGNCKGAQVSSGFVSPRKKDGISKAKSPVKPMNQKEVLVESKFMKKIKNQHAIKNAQSDCSSEDSTPVSVLDLDEFLIHDLTHLSDYASPQEFNPGKKSSPKTTNFDYPFSQATRSWSPGDDAKYYIEAARKLTRLTEDDIKESNWLGKNLFNLESFEEICLDFAGQILDLLVKQVAEELVGLHVENIQLLQ